MLETLVAAMLIGLIPAVVARMRGVADGPGLGFVEWWLFGALLFIVALPCACLARPRSGSNAGKYGKTWHDNKPPPT
jgi:hypothetical protein